MRRPFLFMLALEALAGPAAAQQAPLTLEQAVNQALDKYPAVRASIEQVAAAAAGINLARTVYLPRADFVGQMNRATRNNVFGLLLPQPVIPPMTGPVLGTNSLTSVWGTAVGGLVSWEPFDFGLRLVIVGVAHTSRDGSKAQSAVTHLPFLMVGADV